MRNPFQAVVAQEQPVIEEKTPSPDDKEVGGTAEQSPSGDSDTDVDSINKDAQTGVQNIEAITKVWSTRDLYIAYILYVLPRLLRPYTQA